MEVRGANTFPLLNRLPNLNLVAMTILSVFFLSVGFIDIFPFLFGINKVRWRLCCTPNARERVESHFYRYTMEMILFNKTSNLILLNQEIFSIGALFVTLLEQQL